VEKYLSLWSDLEQQKQSNINGDDNDNDETNEVDIVVDNDDDENDEDDIMKLTTAKKKTTPINTKKIFQLETQFQLPPELPEETEELANSLKSTFKISAKNNWIQNYMENINYEIHEVETNGDCFFAVIRDAFKQIGKNTTVTQLRQILVEEITDDIYQEYRNIFISFESTIRKYMREMEDIKKTLDQLKKRSKESLEKKDAEIIVQEAMRLKQLFQKLSAEKKETNELIQYTTGDLTNINTFDKFKQHLQTQNYWADTWAISTLEKKLNCKMIILSEESFNDGARNSVLNCGEINRELQQSGKFTPEYYIVTSYSSHHYRLVSYKNKKILLFKEIPYHIKVLIINKCFEKNAGIYYLIEDFRNLKTKLGIEPDEGAPLLEEEEDDNEENDKDHTNKMHDLYDPDVIFMFYSKSENKAKPGKGSGEKISKEQMNEYITLGTIDNWRRKLDDYWNEDANFTVDGKKYASVEHYYQGSKFKNGFPDFAQLFALDSDSDISKDVNLCKAAGSKTGKIKTQFIRPKHIKIDPDFYPLRSKEERQKAVLAKFTQNENMKYILQNTKRAKLCHYVVKNPPEIDTILMSVRQKIL
jgi:predicted NAD-dependent protein-ADP-ribosyltransferase YbiA (DUF1768 family)